MHLHKQPNSDMCFVCGRHNPAGLYMQFYDNGENEVCSDYTVPARYQSYPGIVHGGILASMLDEVIGRVAMIGDQPGIAGLAGGPVAAMALAVFTPQAASRGPQSASSDICRFTNWP